MAGRIKDEDIAEVREKARIDDVISGYVTLRNAGGGSQKGLCPFHDEKSPSFHVTPAKQMFYCFGCGEGGDVISFLMKIDGITFGEAVERLADKVGIQLRREDGDGPQAPRGPARGRLVEAHRIAEAFYRDQLATPEAIVARQFLGGRGFDQAAADQFGVGYAPRDGEALFRMLRQKGFSPEELVTSGLVGQGRSHYDRFRGRLLWPIRESNGETVGFGARRIHDDDRIEAKYLNTPESPIYKKSHVLYGLDMARKEIGRSAQAVIVEGYTDVMACHLAGVPTAVATCGTAFGDDHARVLRRFMDDHGDFRGEVIFCFDGDAAGQKAALRAFGGDQNFSSQTYVAVEPSGMDPCDLRLEKGDEAVRELVAGRVPLYRFVLGNVISRYDLDRADGRVDALREAARLVSSVRDKSKVDAFSREVAALIGVDVDEARAEVRRAAARGPRQERGREQVRTAPVQLQQPGQPQGEVGQPAAPAVRPLPDLRDPRFALERETLKLILQYPAVVANTAREVTPADFTHPTYAHVWASIVAGGGPAAGAQDAGWAARLRDQASDPAVVSALNQLAVEPVRSSREPDAAYVLAHVARLLELSALRRIADLKSRLQRTNPVDHPEEYNRMFGELVALEQHRRQLRHSAESS